MKRFLLFLTLLAALASFSQNPTVTRDDLYYITQEIDDPNLNLGYNAFGNIIKIEGNTMVVAAKQDTSGGDITGLVYVYEKNQSTFNWDLVQTLKPDVSCGTNCSEQFGSGIALSKNEALIVVQGSGGVYIFEKTVTGLWNEFATQFELIANGGCAGKFSIAISEPLNFSDTYNDGIRIAVSACTYDSNRGGVAILKHSFETDLWFEENVVLNPSGQNGDYLGVALAWSGNTLFASAPGINNTGTIFQVNITEEFGVAGYTIHYELVQSISGSDLQTNDFFGAALIANSNTLIAAGSNGNKAYIFNRDATTNSWPTSENQILYPSSSTIAFGQDISFTNTGFALGCFSKEIYVYSKEVNQMAELKEIISPDLQNPSFTSHPLDIFGGSVAADGNDLIIETRNQSTFGSTIMELKKAQSLPNSERLILEALYNDTDGDNWTVNNGWNSNLHPRLWHGIQTSSINGTERITAIDLIFNNLVGELPNNFNQLEDLNNLYLSNNALSGIIPDLTSTSLTKFWIHNNNFRFGDFENEFTDYQNNLTEFIYTPQNSPAQGINTRVLNIGDATTLNSEPISGANNIYQWYFNGQPISGANTTDLTLSNFQANEAGTYECFVSNAVVTGLTISAGVFEVDISPSSYQDYAALVDFYNATNGDNWTNNTNWLDNTKPISSWYGVTLSNGRITGLNLNSNNLNGTIPESFSSLTELQSFSIRLNLIYGSFPLDTFYNQTKLQYVDINSNNMTGYIPPEISNLTDLWYMDIGWNYFTGSIPEEMTNLTNLQYAYLHNNQLEGSIPSGPGALPNLQVLYLANNNLSGTVPDLGLLPSLTNFNISSNKFIFADIEPNYTSLNSSLGVNFVHAPQQFIDESKGVAADIGETVTLNSLTGLGTNLTVSWYSFDGSNYAYLGAGDTFDITINSAADYGDYIYYVTSPTITGLGLQSELITIGPEPSSHPDYNALVAIYNALDGPNWTDSWDITAPINTWGSRIGFSPTNNRVTILGLGSNNLSGVIPSEIGDLTELEELYLNGNNISGELPTEIWSLVNARILILGIQNTRELTLLNGIPTTVSNLQNLEWLNLTFVQIAQPLPSELFNLPNLLRIRMAESGLTGTLPLGFANIDNVILSGNEFEGAIPQEFLNATGNTSLTISDNFFDFTDLEPLVNLNNYGTLNYSPQRTRDIEQTIDTAPGSDIIMDVDDTGIGRTNTSSARANAYQWFKDNTAIGGAVGSTYTITNAQASDSGIYYCEITNMDLPDLIIRRADITVNVDPSLSNEEIVTDNIKIYPNPTSGLLNIQLGSFDEASILIYDISGRQILRKQINGTKSTLNIGHLQNGVYLMQINSNQKTMIKRIVKQ